MAIAEATNARRDSDGFMFILLFLGCFTGWRGRDDRRRWAVLDGCDLTSCAPVGANRIGIVQRMRADAGQNEQRVAIGMDLWRMVDNAPSAARSA